MRKATLFLIYFFLPIIKASSQSSLPAPKTASSSVFFNISTCVQFETNTPGAVIRYTINGEEPSENSPVYKEPICISSSLLIKARSFATGNQFSGTTRVHCIRSNGWIKEISGTEPDPRFSVRGISALHDNLAGSSVTSERWIGFSDDAITLGVKLKEKMLAKKIHISLLRRPDSSVFYPARLELFSKKKMLGLVLFDNNGFKSEGEARIFSIPLRKKKVNHLLIRIQKSKIVPGEKNWIFLDEIIVE